MRLLVFRILVFTAVALAAISVAVSMADRQGNSVSASSATGSVCSSQDSGLKLPPGFCATVFADGMGHARHLVVAPSGVVYVNTWSGRYYPPNQPAPPGGFLVALQDTTGTGKADVVKRFGGTEQTGDHGGTGIALYNGSLYAESNDRIVRYALSPGEIVPAGPPVTVVSGLPLGGDHPMHPFFITSDGLLYVDVATATNACQLKNRMPLSPGARPCTELKTRGGIWRYDARKTDQHFSPAERYATGIRNAEGFGIDAIHHRVYVTQHGRDQLYANWPAFYKPDEEATLPSEEVLLLKQGGDYGWPECYYDPYRNKLVLAPEYGGDGGHTAGVCSSKIGPLAAFPAHWAPNAMTFYSQEQFPAFYRGGLFIAFHGSWDRAPYSQGGYNIVYQELSPNGAAGRCQIFADGFSGGFNSPGEALHRPSGVAVGPDGALYVSDDVRGRIYKIVYKGGAQDALEQSTYRPCPSLTASPGEAVQASAKPPEGTHPDAGNAALPVPPGATPAMVALGNRIFHGQTASGTCLACHGPNGQGTPLGPDLTRNKWLWSNGSWAGITKTITQGVMQPKQYRSPMPPNGGAPLNSNDSRAVAAYVWALSHR